MQRWGEYLHGSLPQAHGLDATWRQARRVVSLREDLVRRRRQLRNQIKAYFAHETWESTHFWTAKGMAQLKRLIASLPASVVGCPGWFAAEGSAMLARSSR